MQTNVLVVEDSPLLHRMYEIVLQGYQRSEIKLSLAANGREGLQRLAETPDTDVVFLDVNMPQMDGLEFLARVKEEPTFRDIPVIIVSTEDRQDDVDRGLEAGAREYLCKPFTPEQIYYALDCVLRGREAAGDKPSESDDHPPKVSA